MMLILILVMMMMMIANCSDSNKSTSIMTTKMLTLIILHCLANIPEVTQNIATLGQEYCKSAHCKIAIFIVASRS